MKNVIQALKAFRDERDWAQFHNPKDLAAALSIEASELQELFLWKHPDKLEDTDPQRVREELADILAYALLLADYYAFDIEQMVLDKIEQNGRKYPVEKAKGTAKKYNDL
jgi:NTP pyrophosphatase (non-canonical NTP hydrolase)